MSEVGTRKLGLKEDWASIPYLLIVITGFIVSIYDFWKIQNMRFQLNVPVIIGIILLVIGGTLRMISRRALMKAGFGLVNSSRLQIVENQRLVTNGVYNYIRHPLYLGEINRNLGFAILLSSLYGLAVMFLGNIFLLFRIEIEERMLIDEFGDEYEEYRKRTNKLFPYIY
jgi:protein-S-isoprenylcysteine O-methyltransferase Ste14